MGVSLSLLPCDSLALALALASVLFLECNFVPVRRANVIIDLDPPVQGFEFDASHPSTCPTQFTELRIR
jgi:hypothetical protein